MKSKLLLIGTVFALCLGTVCAVESMHFGFNSSYPTMTDSIRLSTRIGYAWWSSNTRKYNPENGATLPYAYHDGYVEWIGASKTSAQAAERWYKIRNGQGDPWTGATAATVGNPTIIVLDEITTIFSDSGQGPALKEALRLYITNYGGNRSHIIGMAMRSVSLASNPANYSNVIYCANNYLRYLGLELYCSHKGFITGYDPDQPSAYLGTDDAYLANRMAMPIRRWCNAGATATRLMPTFAVSNWAESQGTTAKSFYKFLNRQFWFLANGWYTADRSVVDGNIKTALRNGVGSYTWTPGTGWWQLSTGATTRDSFHEKYIMWYSVGGNLAAHGDGVDAR